MSSLDSQLLDELARCYVEAVVRELLLDPSAPIAKGDVNSECDSPADHESARRLKR